MAALRALAVMLAAASSSSSSSSFSSASSSSFHSRSPSSLSSCSSLTLCYQLHSSTSSLSPSASGCSSAARLLACLSASRVAPPCAHFRRQSMALTLRGGSSEHMPTSDAAGEVERQNHTSARPSNTEGGCPHGRHSSNPDEQHCMECEVMAFLQRAAMILQQAGGRMDSNMFSKQWTAQYPDDPLTPEQVATAVGGILKESGYFHVEETNDPMVKLFELIEQADDGNGLGDSPPTICLPFELAPPEKDTFVDRARSWLAMTGVGRHPAVGSGRMTHEALVEAISPNADNAGKRRHDEVQYTGKWGEQLVGYWTLGSCDGSNGCLHQDKYSFGGQHHWTCCGSTDICSVFCTSEGDA